MENKNKHTPRIEYLDSDEELVKMHERMRAEDAYRIASGQATPEQIQDENSIFPRDVKIILPKFTI